MIDEVLSFISNELNAFFKLRFELNEDKVLLSGIVNQDGSVATQEENKVIVSLVDVREEYTLKNNTPYVKGQDGLNIRTNPAIHLNLYILFSSYFASGNYKESLKYLSNIIQYFQAKPVYTAASNPNLEKSGIQKLVFEMHDLDSQAKNNLWAVLGAKYMPSVMYKVRMLTFFDPAVKDIVGTVQTIDQTIKKN